ncbi:MAG: hypothetical protein IPG23_11450 [Burkholderiales bacterium]|nr:hypothetical protein [Burkholderiales bacterium]
MTTPLSRTPAVPLGRFMAQPEATPQRPGCRPPVDYTGVAAGDSAIAVCSTELAF